MICLDTGILIEILKGNPEIKLKLQEYTDEEELAATSISEYELLKYNDEIKRSAATLLLDNLKIYDFDRAAAVKSSEIFNKLRQNGRLINEADILIAGIVLSKKGILITKDKDFKEIGSEHILVL